MSNTPTTMTTIPWVVCSESSAAYGFKTIETTRKALTTKAISGATSKMSSD